MSTNTKVYPKAMRLLSLCVKNFQPIILADVTLMGFQ